MQINAPRAQHEEDESLRADLQRRHEEFGADLLQARLQAEEYREGFNFFQVEAGVLHMENRECEAQLDVARQKLARLNSELCVRALAAPPVHQPRVVPRRLPPPRLPPSTAASSGSQDPTRSQPYSKSMN